jgi:putative tricarboxylic transport membrane protein
VTSWSKMNLPDPDQWSGLFWLITSVFVCVESITNDIGTPRSPGPGFIPFWSGVVLGMLSIALLIASIPKREVEKRISSLWKGMAWYRVILVLASLFVYTILLPRLGYLIATSGLLALLFRIMSRQSLWVQVVSVLLTTLASYLVFYTWLGVQLPKGILSF